MVPVFGPGAKVTGNGTPITGVVEAVTAGAVLATITRYEVIGDRLKARSKLRTLRVTKPLVGGDTVRVAEPPGWSAWTTPGIENGSMNSGTPYGPMFAPNVEKTPFQLYWYPYTSSTPFGDNV